jgi:hypothetical protein
MYHRAEHQQELLKNWRWLVGGLPTLLGWSSAGDLFVAQPNGVVQRIDTGYGELEPVAESIAQFEEALGDPEVEWELCLLPVVRQFEQEHGPLLGNECLGFTTLPIFKGTYSAENRYRLTIAEHAAFTGDLHSQIRDLPDGAMVRLKIIP